ncbi:MAG: VPLPA-CTERM sorting domain-containing protein [Porticoccaceae bacterium]|nr:VPLPA-CTERM sorting domain-containing protein [Porticoccaceae bacterium]
MKMSYRKLLQSFAGLVLLSSASFSMAATYDYDFDADEAERGAQPLNFGDLNVYGYKNGVEANAYLDSGVKAGIGVCGKLLSEQQGTNWCNPASDDNLQANEVLKFVFDAAKKVSVVGINGPHISANGQWVRIWTDTQGWDLLQVASDKITPGFYLTTLKVFGTMTGAMAEKYGRGTTTDLYVAGINEVPIPAAVWLFGSALLGLTGLRRRKIAA